MSLYVGHTFTTVEDCEDAWNETVDGDVTSSLNTTDFCVGAGSAQLVCTSGLGAGDLMATEARASLDISLCTHIALWVKSTVALSAGDIQLLLDEHASCASPSESLNIPATDANTWTRHVIALAGTAADRNAIISVGLKQVVDKGAFTLMVDDVQAFIGKSYDILSHPRGMGDPEEIELNAALPIKLLDGSYYACQVPSFNRVITVNFGPVDSQVDRVFLFTSWCKSEFRLISEGDEVTVVRSADKFANEWLHGLYFAKAFTMQVLEKTARTTNPRTWG